MAFASAARTADGRLSVERLEARLALAGNVAVSLSDGTLVVRGDNRGATITISQPSPGQITVSGTDTTVNGAVDSVTFSGVTRNLFIRLGRGSDRLTIDQTAPIVVPGNVHVLGGGGGDHISTIASPDGVFHVGGAVRIRTLSGKGRASFIELGNLDVALDLRIRTAGQGCMVGIDGGGDAGPKSRIGGDVVIVNDVHDAAFVRLASMLVAGDIAVTSTGSAGDTGLHDVDATRDIRILTRDARETTARLTNSNVGGSLSVRGGGTGWGSVFMESSTVHGSTTVAGGPGADAIVVNGMDFRGAVSVVTGRGADRLGVGSESVYSVIRPVIETREQASSSGAGTVQYQVVGLVAEQRGAAGGPVQFEGSVHVSLGGGPDALDLGTDATVAFLTAAAIDGRGGRNEARVNRAHVAGAPTLRAFTMTNP